MLRYVTSNVNAKVLYDKTFSVSFQETHIKSFAAESESLRFLTQELKRKMCRIEESFKSRQLMPFTQKQCTVERALNHKSNK